jgi:hypothetical protein
MAGLSNDIVLAFIHERVPAYAPLPDIVFDATTYMPAALHISEYAMLLNTVMAFTCTLLNKHRFTLLKRCARRTAHSACPMCVQVLSHLGHVVRRPRRVDGGDAGARRRSGLLLRTENE